LTSFIVSEIWSSEMVISVIHALFEKWSKFIAYLRAASSAAAFLIMIFFSVVSEEGRMVTVPGAAVAAFVLYRDFRTIRSWRDARP
jgi:hypothetical protein